MKYTVHSYFDHSLVTNIEGSTIPICLNACHYCQYFTGLLSLYASTCVFYLRKETPEDQLYLKCSTAWRASSLSIVLDVFQNSFSSPRCIHFLYVLNYLSQHSILGHHCVFVIAVIISTLANVLAGYSHIFLETLVCPFLFCNCHHIMCMAYPITAFQLRATHCVNNRFSQTNSTIHACWIFAHVFRNPCVPFSVS